MEENKTKIRNILFNEISLLSSFVAIAIGAVLFITKPDTRMQQDIALIKKSIETIETNHLVHIQDAIDEIKNKNEIQDNEINDLIRKIDRTLIILESHIENGK